MANEEKPIKPKEPKTTRPVKKPKYIREAEEIKKKGKKLND
jgi:hypothetical protein